MKAEVEVKVRNYFLVIEMILGKRKWNECILLLKQADEAFM